MISTRNLKLLLLFLLQLFAMDVFAQLQPIESGVFHWNAAPVKKEEQRESRKIAEGTTPEFDYFEIHATTQMKGAIPKPPHTQKDIEELIIIKEGKVKCTIGNKTETLGKGSIIVIPPLESQAFENVGDGPLTYYVFMFRSKKPMDIDRSKKAGGILLLNADTTTYTEKDERGTRKYFDQPTTMTDNYEMHVSYLKHKGPSHAGHKHVDTEIILVIDGYMEMDIDGKNYKGSSGDMFIAVSNNFHQVSNASEKPCSYFAFKWR